MKKKHTVAEYNGNKVIVLEVKNIGEDVDRYTFVYTDDLDKNLNKPITQELLNSLSNTERVNAYLPNPFQELPDEPPYLIETQLIITKMIKREIIKKSVVFDEPK